MAIVLETLFKNKYCAHACTLLSSCITSRVYYIISIAVSGFRLVTAIYRSIRERQCKKSTKVNPTRIIEQLIKKTGFDPSLKLTMTTFGPLWRYHRCIKKWDFRSRSQRFCLHFDESKSTVLFAPCTGVPMFIQPKSSRNVCTQDRRVITGGVYQ